MPKSRPPLWTCPKCKRRFANRKQSHSCTTITVAECLAGKSAETIALFKAFEELVRACGPVRVHPTPSRIAFITRMTFASVKLRKHGIELGLILPYRSPSSRFHAFLPHKHGGLHALRVEDAGELDAEVRGWIADAWRVGLQEPAPPVPPAPVTRADARSAATRKPRKRARRGVRAGRVFYLHWNERELEERVAPLRAAGHEVRTHWDAATTPKFGTWLPEVMVVSLDRLPSHGRAYAGWLWEAKKRRHIPLVFAGGQADKVAVARHLFPGAMFCARGAVPDTVNRLMPD